MCRLFWCSLILSFGPTLSRCPGQDLAPRAYLITPVHSNAVTLVYSLFDGNILLDGAVPITDSRARVNVAVFSYTHSLKFLGRSANVSASVPYGIGYFRGDVLGAKKVAYRSGLLDSTLRVSVNIKGGPAMSEPEFARWRQTTIIGASLRLFIPNGQYDPTTIINYGTNRWALKPEVGYSRRLYNWILDAYGGVWFYTVNHSFFPGASIQSQNPVGALEGHVSYDFRPRLWVSLDGNFWFGGSTSLNGVQNPVTRQSNSRVGFTLSIPFRTHQSIKISYSDGTYVRYGGNFANVSVGWQYSWLGYPAL